MSLLQLPAKKCISNHEAYLLAIKMWHVILLENLGYCVAQMWPIRPSRCIKDTLKGVNCYPRNYVNEVP